MNKQGKGNPLGYEPIPVLLKRFAIPSIVAMLVSSLYNIVDQIFIGQGVGYLGNAATNVAFPFTTICLAIALLIGIGSASNFSLELGRGNQEEAGRCVGNAVWMVAVLGIAYFIIIQIFLEPMLKAFGATENVLPYARSYARITAIGMPFLIFTNAISALIRADGSPKYSMMCMVVGAIVNTILDPVFIFGFKLGVAGAALATVISQVVSFVVALNYIRQFKQVKVNKKSLRPDLRKCLNIASLGMSNSLNQVGITVVQIVLNNSLTYYGAQSIYGEDIPLSSFGIVMKVNSILIAVFVGLSQGSQPIVGYNYGAKQFPRVRSVYKRAVSYSFVVSILGFLVFQFFPKQVIAIFGSGDALYFEFAVKALRIFLFMTLVNGVQIISSNFFAAIGKPLKGVVLSLSRQVILLIPLVIILPMYMGIDGILYAGPIADASACIISLVLIVIEFNKMKKIESTRLETI